MERNRWYAGHTVGQEEKLEKKINRDLVSWEALDKAEGEKDSEQIRAISRALKNAADFSLLCWRLFQTVFQQGPRHLNLKIIPHLAAHQ